ncbi:MAG: MFS transporter, partial [Pseudomonadota bacterium]|nr:MFS transporter [Pseudomonadota bacterium]
MPGKWLKALKVYYDRRMLIMLGLGFSSGFPLLLVFGTLNLWLDASGISYALIGAFSLVKTPYSFKWMWSPIVDRVRLPFFDRLGRRRGWAVFTQIVMMLAILGMSTISPAEHTCWLAAMAVLVTIASASQDIVLDAFRIESFRDNEQGAGAAIFVLGYRLGMVFSGAVALWLAAYMSWNQVYFIMAFGALVGVVTVLYSKEPIKDRRYKEPALKGNFKQRLHRFIDKAVVEPFADFMKRPNWKLILLFVFLYRMSDAYMGPMANVFYVKMGFSTAEIASISKLFGMGAT